MHTSSKVVRTTTAAAAAVVLGSLLTATPAAAQTTGTTGCPQENNYSISKVSSVHRAKVRLKDGPGPATVTVKVEKESSLGADVTVGAEGSVGGVVASAKASISATVRGSVKITVGHTVSKNIARGKYLNSHYGSWGKKFDYYHYRVNRDCSTTSLGRGYDQWVPTTSRGWKFFHSSR
ncbi:hypothetical protein ACFCV3_17830 [Kribbella sp. NPDC056345]|uniref:hypothetical protein n=1 Tax=Kribbella sp. NPDC056345 TaxID=3345789 RepID=UPI0035E24B27